MALSISHRCLNIAPSLTLQIDTRAKEMAASGMNVIGFGAGEPDFPTPQNIVDAAKDALDAGFTKYTAAAGIAELRDGSHDLADGIVTLDEEGISKLTDLLSRVSGDRLKALIEAAKSCQTCSGLADGAEGTVKFVWRTEGIGE